MPNRQIYLLSPKELSPETIAVAFAKTSRSPESFREIAAGLTDAKSAQFHEKWVVGYGHASVAEHAVLHIAFENVSRLAIESIESNRLASYTEKSTRYQKWAPDDFFVPSELDGHPLREAFITVCRLLFETYQASLDPVRAVVMQRAGRRENESDEALDRRVRTEYVDVSRFLLPAASLANVGMTANARVLENVIRKMLSHELAEVREIGEAVREVAIKEIPTLVKYAEAVPYLIETHDELGKLGNWEQEDHLQLQPARIGKSEWCRLVSYDKDAEDMVLAAALYRFGEMDFAAALARVNCLSASERVNLAAALLGKLDQHDIPLRELEYCTYTFDLVMDQGAYAEFKRHRMMTQTPQKLTTRLGYATPRLITDAGFKSQYEAAMNAAAEISEKLSAFNPHVGQYVVPNGYKRRVLARFNLREAYAFCQLRSAPNAHFAIRRIANGVYEEMRSVHPLLTAYMHLPEETWEDVEERYFTSP